MQLDKKRSNKKGIAMNTKKILFTTFIIISSAIIGASAPALPSWTLDKKQLIQTIGDIGCLSQRHHAHVLIKDAIALPDIHQNNQELAQDLNSIFVQCLNNGENQEIMSAFCKKWGIKELQAKYTEDDYK